MRNESSKPKSRFNIKRIAIVVGIFALYRVFLHAMDPMISAKTGSYMNHHYLIIDAILLIGLAWHIIHTLSRYGAGRIGARFLLFSVPLWAILGYVLVHKTITDFHHAPKPIPVTLTKS